jgi:hypothetical protein
MTKPPSPTHRCPACKRMTGRLVTDLTEERPILDGENGQYVCTDGTCRCQFCVTPGGAFTNIRPDLIPVEQDRKDVPYLRLVPREEGPVE